MRRTSCFLYLSLASSGSHCITEIFASSSFLLLLAYILVHIIHFHNMRMNMSLFHAFSGKNLITASTSKLAALAFVGQILKIYKKSKTWSNDLVMVSVASQQLTLHNKCHPQSCSGALSKRYLLSE